MGAQPPRVATPLRRHLIHLQSDLDVVRQPQAIGNCSIIAPVRTWPGIYDLRSVVARLEFDLLAALGVVGLATRF